MNLFKLINLSLFIILSLIWGSSYILIKFGLYSDNGAVILSAYQVAALRVLAVGLSALPIALIKRQNFSFHIWIWLIASGMFGILIPAFLFCVAETRVDSSLADILTVLAPVFLIMFNYFCFRVTVSFSQILGVFIAFIGVVFLMTQYRTINYASLGYALLVILATASYAVNTLIIRHKLVNIPPLMVTAFSFVPLILPSLAILIFNDFFSLPIYQLAYRKSTAAACLLGIMCSAAAWVVFYQLMKRTSALFASSVAFLIPVVAFAWGWVYGEHITIIHTGCMLLIFYGVYLTNPELRELFKAKIQN